MKNIRFPFLFLIFLLLWDLPWSEAQQISYNRYTAMDGLPTDELRSLYIDNHQWLWVGTDAGVARYDKGVFIRIPALDTLNSMHVWAITGDDTGNLFFGTYGNGLLRWDGDTLTWFNSANSQLPGDHIRILSWLPEYRQMLIGGRELLAVMDSTGIVPLELPPPTSRSHLNSSTRLVYQLTAFRRHNDTVTIFGNGHTSQLWQYLPAHRLVSPKNHHLPEATYWNGLTTADGQQYMGMNRDSYAYKPVGGKWSVHQGMGQVFDFLEDPTGRVWAAAWADQYSMNQPGGLFLFDNGQMTHMNDALNMEKFDAWNLLYDTHNQCLWVTTLDAGLLQIPMTLISKQSVGRQGNAPRLIHALYADQHHRLWIASDDNLMVMQNDRMQVFDDRLLVMPFLKKYQQNFDTYTRLVLETEGLTAKQFSNRYMDDYPLAVMMTDVLSTMAGLDRNTVRTGADYYLRLQQALDYLLAHPQEAVLPLRRRYDLLDIGPDSLLLKYPYGLYRIADDHSITYICPSGGHRIVMDDQRVIHLGDPLSTGLSRIDLKADSPYPIRTFSAAKQDMARHLNTMVSNGPTIWYGTYYDGLYHSINGHFTHLNATLPLPGNITAIVPLGDSIIMAAGVNGKIYCLVRRGDEWILDHTLGPAQGLSAKTIHWMLRDSSRMYIGAGHELIRVNTASLLGDKRPAFETFTAREGYQPQNGRTTGCLDGNRLYVASGSQLMTINLSLLDDFHPNNQSVFLQSFTINTPGQPRRTIATPFDQDTDDTVYQLSHHDNFPTFHFSTNNRLNPGQDEYRHRLQGLDTAWSEPSSMDYLYFTNLNPGNYMLEVSAGPQKSPQGHHLLIPFVIHRAWWQTPLFRILLLVVTGTCFLLLFRWRINHLRRQQEQRMEIRERISGLKLEALRAQMNPHFTFNVLTAVQNSILKNQTELALQYLNQISTLMRTTLDMATRPLVTLDEEVHYLRNYIDLETMRMNGKMKATLEVDPGLLTFPLLLPPMVIQPVIENAIRHGLGKRSSKGILSVRFHAHNATHFRCVVTDNGPGLDDNQPPEDHQSKGLAVIRERLRLINQTGKQAPATFRLENLPDGQGVRVVLELPLIAHPIS